jgi:hypothetical protein
MNQLTVKNNIMKKRQRRLKRRYRKCSFQMFLCRCRGDQGMYQNWEQLRDMVNESLKFNIT